MTMQTRLARNFVTNLCRWTTGGAFSLASCAMAVGLLSGLGPDIAAQVGIPTGGQGAVWAGEAVAAGERAPSITGTAQRQERGDRESREQDEQEVEQDSRGQELESREDRQSEAADDRSLDDRYGEDFQRQDAPPGAGLLLPGLSDPDEPSSVPLDHQDLTLRFAFKNERWSTVIDWFAEQLDLVVYAYSDYPRGTFTNVDGKDYTVKDALDQLNHMLMLEGYTLLRFNNYLIVIDHARDGIPPELVPTVAPEELDDRGFYELVNCKFDISNLDPDFIERQVAQIVQPPRGAVRLLAVSDQLLVRENAGRLRMIREILDRAQSRAEIVYKRATLDYIPFEMLMQVARMEFGMSDGENRLGDGTLAVSLLNTETRPWISGTPDKVDRLLRLIEKLDTPENSTREIDVEGYVIRYYTPRTDPQIVYRIMTNYFDGRTDIRITISDDSDVIYVKARPKDHAEIDELVANLESNAMAVAAIPCYRLRPNEMILRLKTALGMPTSLLMDDERDRGGNKTVFMEDTFNDQVIVRGTRRMIYEVQELAKVLDPPPSEGTQNKPPFRQLQIDDSYVDDLVDSFDRIWNDQYSQPNVLKWTMPQDRRPVLGSGSGSGSAGLQNPGYRFPSYDRQFGRGSFDQMNPGNLTPDQLQQLMQLMQLMAEQQAATAGGETEPTRLPEVDHRPGRTEGLQSSPARSGGPDSERLSPPQEGEIDRPRPRPVDPVDTTTRRSLTGRETRVVSLAGRRDSREPAASQDRPAADHASELYAMTPSRVAEAPAPKAKAREFAEQDDDLPPVRTAQEDRPTNGFQSVPGDPVFIEKTPSGLMIRSRDMQALDLAEQILRSLARETTYSLDSAGLPSKTVFFLGYRSAAEIADEIEDILGVGGGGGGGGGGLPGMLGNMAQNAMGQAAGGMLDAFMGGGGGGGSSSPKTVGEVSIHVDNFLNAMIVYAGPEDTDEIESLIELKDRPTAPHDPRIYGETLSIKIQYRDPEVVKEQVELHFSPYLRKPEGQGGGQGQGQGQGQINPQQLIAMLQGGGRNRRGGGGGGMGGSSEPAKPTISVSVDVEAKRLLVMGPGYLLKLVENFVSEMDYEDAVEKKTIALISPPPGVTPAMINTAFAQYFQAGTATQPATGRQQAPGTGGQARGGQPGGGAAGGAGGAMDIMRAIEAQRARGGGGGNFGGAGGGGNFGGGNRGGTGNFGGAGGRGTQQPGGNRRGGR